MLPLAQAIARVFARLGEKKNRSRARIKFLVQDLGIEKFKELVLEERKILPHDPRWTEYIEDAEKFRGRRRCGPAASGRCCGFRGVPALAEDQHAAAEAGGLRGGHRRAAAWATLPPTSCGRSPISSRRFTKETIRTTVEQNFVASLGEPQRSARNLQGARSRGARRRPARATIVDIVIVPRHGYLQARHFFVARAGRGTAQAARREKFRAR